MSEKILVVGGTGMLGLPVVKQLLSDGFDVSVLTTNIEKAQEKLPDQVNIIEGDVTDLDSLKRAVEGHSMVHLNLNAKMTPELYEKIEIGGCQNASQVAKELGVKRIGYISGASSKGEKRGIIYLDAKVEAENRIIESGVPYSIFRAGWFYETLPSFIQQGKAIILGDQPHGYSWLSASDYAKQVSNAYKNEDAANTCFYNLGPEKMTMMEALARYCAICQPDMKPEKLSFTMANMISYMPGMEKLKIIIPFFEYFSNNPENVDKSETDALLGANTTTLEEWCRGLTK